MSWRSLSTNSFGKPANNRLSRPPKTPNYFKLNGQDEIAGRLSYVNIVENFAWSNKRGVWGQHLSSRKIIGAIGEISPNWDHELFCLRVHVKGATSFENLRTERANNNNGELEIVCGIYGEACEWRGLFMDENFYNHAMKGASERNVTTSIG